MRQRDIPFVSWRATQAGVGSASSAGPDITRDLPRPRGRAEGRLRPPVGGGPHDKRRTDMQNNLTRRNFSPGLPPRRCSRGWRAAQRVAPLRARTPPRRREAATPRPRLTTATPSSTTATASSSRTRPTPASSSSRRTATRSRTSRALASWSPTRTGDSLRRSAPRTSPAASPSSRSPASCASRDTRARLRTTAPLLTNRSSSWTATFAPSSTPHPPTLPLSRRRGPTTCRPMSRRPATRFPSTSRQIRATARTAWTGPVTWHLPPRLTPRSQSVQERESLTTCVSWASPCSSAPRPTSPPTPAGRASRAPLARTPRCPAIP